MFLFGLPSSSSDVIRSYDNCSTNSIPDTTPLESISNDRLVKLCVGLNNDDDDGVEVEETVLDKPMCGNGEEFNFYMIKPKARHSNDANLLIEFMGGGACWDAESCIGCDGLLEFPSDFDRLVGLSCSAIKFLRKMSGLELNALCNEKIGENLNLYEYNYLIMPYCTQDIHLGNSIVEYTEEGAPSTVRYHGAHNMMAMLNYAFDNFPNVENVVLTGCSAGANALGAAHSLIRNHYGNDKVRINVLMDTPFILSTEEFQKDHFPIWNIDTIANLMGFDYDAYKYSKDFFVHYLRYVMGQGASSEDIASCDRFGAIQHFRDPIARHFWRDIGGGWGYDEWWQEQSRVFDELKEAGNFETFIIEDGEEHCTFGLYFALQEAGFGDFVDSIIRKVCTNSSPPSTNFSTMLLKVQDLIFFQALHQLPR